MATAYHSVQNVSLDYTVGLRQHTRAEEEPHGTHAARQGLGSSHGPDAAVGPDAAPDRPASNPRGDDAAGLPDAEGRQAQGAHARAHLRHPRPHHPDDRSDPP